MGRDSAVHPRLFPRLFSPPLFSLQIAHRALECVRARTDERTHAHAHALARLGCGTRAFVQLIRAFFPRPFDVNRTQAQQHTILLIQKTKLKSSRTFTDHESIGHSLECTERSARSA